MCPMPDDGTLKPGFPRITYSDTGITTDLEFIVDEEPTIDDIVGEDATPYIGIVKSADKERLEISDVWQVSITCEELFETDEPGTLREVSYEIEWILVERSLFEHPAFQAGGLYELDGGDYVDIAKWKIEQNEALKKAFKYWNVNDDESTSYEVTLSANAQKLANGIILGIETWPDYLPVLRKISRYVNGPPPSSDAGDKETVGSFPGKPTGYEWRKSADRSSKAGGQRKWDRTEEWEGAATVWIDKTAIYW